MTSDNTGATTPTSSGNSSNDDTPDSKNNLLLKKLRAQREKEGISSTSDYDDKIKSKLAGAAGAVSKSKTVSPGSSGGGGVDTAETDPQLADIQKALDDDEDERDLDEETLIALVAERLADKSDTSRSGTTTLSTSSMGVSNAEQSSPPSSLSTGTTTTGVGGSWSQNKTAEIETYRPANGGWGYFPRPKDISKAYGGGRRVGVGYSQEDELSRQKSEEETRRRLQQYREKVGIDVQSEKDHAEEIEEALALAGRAMQRGVYSTAVSCLEKVTKYCSTNSKVGGKVFLELAMAYEASARSDEAITIYTTLTKSRMEDIKITAKKLLYGIEAINFMRNEARDVNFSRKKASQMYVDVTGLDRIAENFDDRYQTAYVDLDRSGNYYKRLTESVVRDTREARQVLLKAVGPEEVDRIRVVQALRSVSRSFDAALEAEREEAKAQAEKDKEPDLEGVAIMNGKPILPTTRRQRPDTYTSGFSSVTEFNLASPQLTLENLSGEWRLQLIADKQGDAVKFFNTTLAWRTVDATQKSFTFVGPPQGLLAVANVGSGKEERGRFTFDEERRVVSRDGETAGGGGNGGGNFLAGLLTGGSEMSGAAKAGLAPQQVMLVDDVLCVTRYAPKGKSRDGNVKDYFCVWRKVENGTFSSKSRSAP